MASSAMHTMFSDPTALMARIGELVTQGRQFTAVFDDGTWCLPYGGPTKGRLREDGKTEVIND